MIKLETEQGRRTSWDYSAGHVPTGPIIKLVKKSFLERIASFVKDLRGEEITDMGSVFFQKESIFPRVKFKEIHSNPTVRDKNKADYVIINKDAILGQLARIWTPHWHYDTNTGIWLSNIGGGIQEQFVDIEGSSWVEKFLLSLLDLQNKKVVLDSDLSRKIPRTVEIKGEIYEKIHKMLSCRDKQSIRIGIELLSNLDYSKFEAETLLLLNANIRNIRNYGLGYTVLFKSLVNLVSRDYPHWDTYDKLSFILNLLEKNQYNERALQYINEYFNTIHPLGSGNYQICIIHNQIKDKIKENELAIQE